VYERENYREYGTSRVYCNYQLRLVISEACKHSKERQVCQSKRNKGFDVVGQLKHIRKNVNCEKGDVRSVEEYNDGEDWINSATEHNRYKNKSDLQ
jgi:hypothetical protein